MLEKTINVPTAPSALLLNLWSDGGNWSQDMSVGAQVVGAFQWIEMTYNVSGGNGGDKCFTGCNVDGVKVQGTPEKAFSSDGSRVLVGMMLRIVVVGVAWIWVG